METKNFTLLANLKEQLKKAKADKEKFENERKKQEYHLELESKCLEMEVQLLQGRINNLNARVRKSSDTGDDTFLAQKENSITNDDDNIFNTYL